MPRRRFRDYGIRPRGSPEIACDPCVLMEAITQRIVDKAALRTRKSRVAEVFNFIVKVALEVLPPKQRKIFYSVWVRSGGRMSKGIMEYSKRTGQSHYTNYNNYYKAVASIQAYLAKSGYEEHILAYLNAMRNEEDDLEMDDDLL